MPSQIVSISFPPSTPGSLPPPGETIPPPLRRPRSAQGAARPPRSTLTRQELRLVALVEEQHAMQLVALEDGPAAAVHIINLGVAVPGELHRRLAVPRPLAGVDGPVDGAEVEPAALAARELDVGGLLLVQVVL